MVPQGSSVTWKAELQPREAGLLEEEGGQTETITGWGAARANTRGTEKENKGTTSDSGLWGQVRAGGSRRKAPRTAERLAS